LQAWRRNCVLKNRFDLWAGPSKCLSGHVLTNTSPESRVWPSCDQEIFIERNRPLASTSCFILISVLFSLGRSFSPFFLPCAGQGRSSPSAFVSTVKCTLEKSVRRETGDKLIWRCRPSGRYFFATFGGTYILSRGGCGATFCSTTTAAHFPVVASTFFLHFFGQPIQEYAFALNSTERPWL